MEKSQIVSIVNKAKAIGDNTYKSLKARTTGVETYSIFSNSSYGYFDDDNEVLVIVRITSDPTIIGTGANPIEVVYVDYADISKLFFYIDGKELMSNKSEFSDIDEENLNSLAKIALQQNPGSGGFSDPHKVDLSVKKPEDGENTDEESEVVEKPVMRPDEVIGHVSIF